MKPRTLLHGILIGMGTVLPGISGGTLAVVFGVYRLFMEFLTHPIQTVRQEYRTLLPLGIGIFVGLCSGAFGVFSLFHTSEQVASCLFIGLILGTLPSLWRESGTQGRRKSAYFIVVFSFFLFLCSLFWLKQYTMYSSISGHLMYFLCGVMQGIGTAIPGLTSAPILMALGWLSPLMESFAALEWQVIFPWLLGFLSALLLLARLVSYLFHKYAMLVFHTVFGITLASTVAVFPLQFDSVAEAAESLFCLLVGMFAAHKTTKAEKTNTNDLLPR